MDIIITKPIVTNTTIQISETEIIAHFNQYYYKSNEVDSIYINSEIYNNYFEVSGSYNIFLEFNSSEIVSNGIIIVNVKNSYNKDYLTLLLLIAIFIIVKISKNIKKYFNKWLKISKSNKIVENRWLFNDNIIQLLLCGYGGTGRRTRLRI